MTEIFTQDSIPVLIQKAYPVKDTKNLQSDIQIQEKAEFFAKLAETAQWAFDTLNFLIRFLFCCFSVKDETFAQIDKSSQITKIAQELLKIQNTETIPQLSKEIQKDLTQAQSMIDHKKRFAAELGIEIDDVNEKILIGEGLLRNLEIKKVDDLKRIEEIIQENKKNIENIKTEERTFLKEAYLKNNPSISLESLNEWNILKADCTEREWNNEYWENIFLKDENYKKIIHERSNLNLNRIALNNTFNRMDATADKEISNAKANQEKLKSYKEKIEILLNENRDDLIGLEEQLQFSIGKLQKLCGECKILTQKESDVTLLDQVTLLDIATESDLSLKENIEPKYLTTKLLKDSFQIFNVEFPSDFDFDKGGTIPLKTPVYIFLDDKDQDERRCYLFGADIHGKSTGGITYEVDHESGEVTFSKGFTSYQKNLSPLGDFHIYSSIEKISSSNKKIGNENNEGQIIFHARINLYQVLGGLYNYISYTKAFAGINEKVDGLKYDEINYDWNKGYEVTFQTKPYSKDVLMKKWEKHMQLKNIEEFGKS